MRTVLEPRLVDPTAFEPGLVVDVRDEKRALLFDLGPPIEALPPRVLLRATHAFVTHTHMDHFAGFDHLLAVGLGRMSTLSLWGGPDFVAQVEHKLRAYTWNVVHRYPVGLRLQVHEAWPDGTRRRAHFDSTQRFVRAGDCTWHADDDVLHDETMFRVRTCFVDHEMTVLAFALEEKAQLRIAAGRLAEAGLTSGAWLGQLKRAVLSGAPGDTPIALRWRDRAGEHQSMSTVDSLKLLVLDAVPGRRIGYVTDLCFSDANIERLHALLADVDLLYIESTFLHADRAHAERKNHLTARQAGEIARKVGAKSLVPFHFSPRYQGREAALIDEARRAWQGLEVM